MLVAAPGYNYSPGPTSRFSSRHSSLLSVDNCTPFSFRIFSFILLKTTLVCQSGTTSKSALQRVRLRVAAHSRHRPAPRSSPRRRPNELSVPLSSLRLVWLWTYISRVPQISSSGGDPFRTHSSHFLSTVADSGSGDTPPGCAAVTFL